MKKIRLYVCKGELDFRNPVRVDVQSTTQRYTITGALPASLTNVNGIDNVNIIDNRDVNAANADLDALCDSEPSVPTWDWIRKVTTHIRSITTDNRGVTHTTLTWEAVSNGFLEKGGVSPIAAQVTDAPPEPLQQYGDTLLPQTLLWLISWTGVGAGREGGGGGGGRGALPGTGAGEARAPMATRARVERTLKACILSDLGMALMVKGDDVGPEVPTFWYILGAY
jgi:hypothetical protein